MATTKIIETPIYQVFTIHQTLCIYELFLSVVSFYSHTIPKKEFALVMREKQQIGFNDLTKVIELLSCMARIQT